MRIIHALRICATLLATALGCSEDRQPSQDFSVDAQPAADVNWDTILAGAADAPTYQTSSFGILSTDVDRQLAIFRRPKIEQVQVPETQTIEHYRVEVRTRPVTSETGESGEETYEVRIPYQETVERMITRTLIRGYESYCCPIASLRVRNIDGPFWTAHETANRLSRAQAAIITDTERADGYFERFLNPEALLVSSNEWTEYAAEQANDELSHAAKGEVD